MKQPINNQAVVTLSQLDRGRVVSQLSDELQKVLEAVQETEKGGTVTLTLDIRPVKNTDGGQVQVTGKVKSVVPRPDRKSTLFFVTDDFQLTRTVPGQKEFWDAEEHEGGSGEASGDADAVTGR